MQLGTGPKKVEPLGLGAHESLVRMNPKTVITFPDVVFSAASLPDPQVSDGIGLQAIC